MLSHDWRIFDVGGARSLVRLGGFSFGMSDEPRMFSFLSEVGRLSSIAEYT